MYAYDRTPLNPTVDRLPDDTPGWRREKVTIDAAYGQERVPAFLFLPKNTAPPFQTVIFFPDGSAFNLRSNAYLETRQVQFLLRSGRAVLCPIYLGTYDRWIEIRGEQDDRDATIRDVKDFRRAVDYLETRGDIDKTKLGYYGISAGAAVAPLMLADEPRIKAAVLLGGCLLVSPAPPEVDQFNFAAHVTIPVLMLNGRYDFVCPVETVQRPMFDALGTPAAQKRHVIFESGHAVIAVQPMVKQILDWLDTYLGPVKTTS